MDSNYQRALEFIYKWEGGYVNDPADPGGATNKGITQRTFNAFLRTMKRAWIHVRHISMADVGEIYRKNYWLASGCDKLPWPIDIVVFDTAVNCGVSRATRWLNMARLTGGDNPRQVAAGVIMLREEHYETIIKANPKLAKFRRGWKNRVEALREEGLGE